MATAIHLVWTGIAMGVVHVLTGPDHLSALATLSSSSSSSYPQVSKCYLFGLGARWGIGHSTGLMLVGGFFIMKDVLQNNHDDNESDDSDGKRLEIPDAVTHLFESFVGIFMLTLGFYGIYEARKIRYNEYTGDDVFVNDPISNNNNNNNKLRPLEVEATEIDSHSDDGYGGDSGGPHRRQDYTEPDDDLEEFRHNHDHTNSSFLACCAGIFHGLAGPGGVLGVVPAIQLHDPRLAICYLLSFCTTSIITMGTFSSAYGTFTTSLARDDDDDDCDDLEVSSLMIVEFWIRCVSASMSLLVGVTWLVLLAMGKLEDIMGRR
ncbi:hypothetical protein FRACYDRAFT_177935 [Fragilariopsis cylindrus CCMP1102]|uniref:Nickel/cobalt efflux system n=1 Tax=Fragilariopsis cylindrus CCMP1102 TaxID=635003 RepID=A0A1E7FUM1_9STRA|nr:hypothetical protein FRACYDRAFT_177935 [Fragilariopsis cylindrus CCMP1102]|eukprot:OEU21834.1 hypothetical protein FRACYDRAFT_177935 [Fragilariopsis cylindrus CCMP1102]